MSQLAVHVRELADRIGPRPATTDAEARAADYLERVMRARGLEVERQEFDAPRSDALAFTLEHAVAIAAAVVSRWAPLPAAALGVAVAVALWLDSDVRRGLTRFMPKGPSQNIIARHVPTARRGERLRKVVIVAHYDSAKATLDASSGFVRRVGAMRTATLAVTALIPLVALAGMLPFARGQAFVWYVTLALAAFLLVPLTLRLQALFARPVDGANDNASGVAAMLGVMERIVPEPEVQTMPFDVVPARRSPEAAEEAGVALDDALLEYTPVTAEREPFGEASEVTWDDAHLPIEPSAGQVQLDFGGAWDEEEPSGETPEGIAPTGSPSKPRRLFGRKRSGQKEHARRLSDWLGLGSGFDARKEGERIKSWDRLAFDEEDEDDDGFGFKGGTAGGDPFAAEEAARIRRKVTMGVDRALAEKEVWFVAAGAKESGAWGMKALLDAYGDDLKDALIVNLDSVGAGALAWLEHEGEGRAYHGDRRLASMFKRVVREKELPVRPRDHRTELTDATAALARRYRAITVMSFDINGRVARWHTAGDTVEVVSEEAIHAAVDLVSEVLREL